MADFGLARVVLDLQGSLMTGGLGTFQWMAPEVLAHQRYSEKADVFSCAPLSPSSMRMPCSGLSGVGCSLRDSSGQPSRLAQAE